MSKKRLTTKASFAYVLVAQAVSMLISTVIVLIVPRVVGVSGYGQLQYFLLISGYITILAFGISDGMYLRCGGKLFSEFESEITFGGEFVALSVISLAECLVVFSGVVLYGGDEARSFVYLCFAIFIPLYLLNNYFGCAFQSSAKMKEYSFSTVLEKGVCLSGVSICTVFGVDDFRPYIIVYIIGKLAALCYSLFKFRKVFSGFKLNWIATLSILKEDIPAGFRLTLSALAAQLILGTGRLFIDGSFGVDEFSQVSLAISMMNFFLVFINQVGNVLFPTLRRFNSRGLSVTYEGLCGVMSIALPIVLLAYYPLSRFIAWWLPAYDSAVLYLGILLPICVFDGKNSMVYTTFLKVRRGESALLGANCAALIISAVLSTLFSLAFRSLKGVIFSLFIAVAIRNVLLTYACNKSMNVVDGPTWAVELGLASCFALANTLLTWPAALSSVLFTSLIYCVVQRRQFEVVMGWLSAVLAERK